MLHNNCEKEWVKWTIINLISMTISLSVLDVLQDLVGHHNISTKSHWYPHLGFSGKFAISAARHYCATSLSGESILIYVVTRFNTYLPISSWNYYAPRKRYRKFYMLNYMSNEVITELYIHSLECSIFLSNQISTCVESLNRKNTIFKKINQNVCNRKYFESMQFAILSWWHFQFQLLICCKLFWITSSFQQMDKENCW